MAVFRFLRTARCLEPAQALAQATWRLRWLWEDPQRFARRCNPPPAPKCAWQLRQAWLPPWAGKNTSTEMLAGRWTFLNRPRRLSWPPEWQTDGEARLWQYNLHYFDYLWALDYADGKTLVTDWTARCPLGRGSIGWESYPTSLRLANWCGYFWGANRHRIQEDRSFHRRLWESAYLQAQWLYRHIERHLLGNHLLENAAALTLAGTCLDGADAARWYRRGMEILAEQLPAQILPDGGHYERSPMYHQRVMHVLAMLLNTGSEELAGLLVEPLTRMAVAMRRMCHGDGQIALFNDSALGVCNPPGELLDYVRRLIGGAGEAGLSVGVFALPDSGYYGSSLDDGTFVICDAGPIGPRCQSGHGHGDVFSFELSLRGCRLIVDSGVHDYHAGPMRDYCRSTAAHNTLTINGLDSCESWGVFRVGRRAEVHDVSWEPLGEGFRLEAWHDGYRHLRGRPVHSRRFTFRRPGVLMFRDNVTSAVPVRGVSRLHLHPDCRLQAVTDTRAEVAFPAGRLTVCFAGPGRLTVEKGMYCPQFGLAIDNPVLAFTSAGRDMAIGACIAPAGAVSTFDLEQGAIIDGRLFGW